MSCVQLKANPDISGIGIRIAFYIQVACLSAHTVRVSSAAECGNALSSLVVTNLAYGVTTLVLSAPKNPSLSLYDALVVIHLLTISWLTIFITIPHYSKFSKSQTSLQFLAILQSYICFATAFFILATAPTFGSNKECNSVVQAVLFAQFPLLKARIGYLVTLTIVVVLQTVLYYFDFLGKHPPKSRSSIYRGHEPDPEDAIPEPSFDGHFDNGRAAGSSDNKSRRWDPTVLFQLILVFCTLIIGIVNTELMVKRNNTIDTIGGGSQSPKDDKTSQWTFGQIIPLALTLLPVWTFVSGLLPKSLRIGLQIVREEHSLRRVPRVRRSG
ncbi:hypothetical protein DL96DRAFT_1622857 [Flagelloscypha sp. PMI_526]|nr:hypothetical protein DL96DRAFT_1622857 [Flagelloscypha sp. PMI_526]